MHIGAQVFKLTIVLKITEIKYLNYIHIHFQIQIDKLITQILIYVHFIMKIP